MLPSSTNPKKPAASPSKNTGSLLENVAIRAPKHPSIEDSSFLAIPENKGVDTQMPCEHCGFVAYNDTLSCVQWCKHARKCVGDEMYEQMMRVLEKQKERGA